MAASVLLACGLNEKTYPSFVHISEENYVDGSFLISCILGQRLKISNAGTLLVCLQHHYQHYFNAGMRLGYNANIFLDKTLNVIDPLQDVAHDNINSKWLADETQITHVLLEAIREQVETNFTNRVSTTIIIDNLGVLMDLGATKEQVMQFCHQLVALPELHPNLAVVTKLNNCQIYESVDGSIHQLAKLNLRVKKLQSGSFREVDGKLVIERESKENGGGAFVENVVQKEILYKVNERNVKIFNPGEVGVVI